MRKTSKDYLNELNDLRLKECALKARIVDRTYKLSKNYPNIGNYHGFLKPSELSYESWFNNIDIMKVLEMLSFMEARLAKLEPYKQLQIEF